MIMMRTLTLTSLLALLTTGHAPAGAVALRQEKATDASICDLGPNTNPVLARRVLIPLTLPQRIRSMPTSGLAQASSLATAATAKC